MGTHYLTLYASAATRIPPCKENLVFELFYTCNGNVKDLFYTLHNQILGNKKPALKKRVHLVSACAVPLIPLAVHQLLIQSFEVFALFVAQFVYLSWCYLLRW
jgi:hypothetical protein